MSNVVLISLRSAKPRSGIVTVSCRNFSNEDREFTNLSAYKRGTGGRSSFNGIVATVFGCTGFLGRYVCNRLGKIGTQLILPYRGDSYEPFRLKLVGDLGQILFHPYHLNDEDSIRKAMKYSNVVINCIGRDWETKNFTFDDVFNEGPRRLARIARESGVARFVHVSSLNASDEPETCVLPNGSKFLKAKAAGERAVLEEFPEATILRPSDIYGQEDRFLRYYMHSWRRQMYMIPLWNNGEKTEKQPVYVSDVAAGIANIVRDPETSGKIYQAVGPKRYLLSELVDYFHRVTRRDDPGWGYKRYDMKWDPLFQLRVTLTEKYSINWPINGLTWEKIEREHLSDNVDSGLPALEDLGVNLTALEEQVPWELRPWIYGQYQGHDIDDPFIPTSPPKVVA